MLLNVWQRYLQDLSHPSWRPPMLSRILRGYLESRPAKSRSRKRSPLPGIEALEDRCLLTVFTVLNTNDSGPDSLRQAIVSAEATPNVGGVPDRIEFNIPGNGVHTIQTTTTLPTITQAVTIDGYTQPGASPNTLTVGDSNSTAILADGTLGRGVQEVDDTGTVTAVDDATIDGPVLALTVTSAGVELVNAPVLS